MGHRFAVDAMLGRTTRKLRILGFDATYQSDVGDDALLETAARENRVLITKDAALYRRARRAGILAVCPAGCDPVAHTLEIAARLGLGDLRIECSRARCTVCNGTLRQDDGPEAGAVPVRISETHDIWRCTGCGRLYWHGSHIDNMRKALADARERRPGT